MVTVTYAFLAIALLFVLPISIAALPATNLISSWAFYIAIVSALAIASVMRREIRRDLSQLCVFWVLVGAIMSLLSALAVRDHPWIGWLGLTFCVSTWVASIVLLIRGALAKDKAPSPMAQRFPAGQVFEVAGVQLAVEITDATRAAQGDVELRIYLQNCWDRERTVTPRLMSRSGFIGTLGGARFDDEETALTIAAGAFGVWILPARLTTSRRVSIFIDLDISGLDGRRIYRRRVRSLPARVPRLVTLLIAVASLGTAWVWGGGLRVKLPAGERSIDSGGRVRRWFPLGAGAA